jgi:hypothetical protein
MVQVKFKPQYLVFPIHSFVTGHKTLDFPCGKFCEAKPGTGLMATLHQKWCKSSPEPTAAKSGPLPVPAIEHPQA